MSVGRVAHEGRGDSGPTRGREAVAARSVGMEWVQARRHGGCLQAEDARPLPRQTAAARGRHWSSTGEADAFGDLKRR